MADCCTPTFLFVLIRSVHYAACLLLLAVWAFDRLILPAMADDASASLREHWQAMEVRWTVLLLPLIAISGVAWFVQLCVNMSGLPLSEAMHAETVRAVWSETSFGRLWQVRLFLWLGWGYLLLFVRGIPAGIREGSARINLILAGALSASLAWAGHGQDGGRWHLLADASHLFIAGVWPMSLAPLAILLWKLRELSPASRRAAATAVTLRFSGVSVLAVSLMVATGVVNSVYVLGGINDLLHTAYGKTLLLKVGLVLFALSFAATNRLRWLPRLAAAPSERDSDTATRALQRNIATELAVGFLVLITTAALGLLAP